MTMMTEHQLSASGRHPARRIAYSDLQKKLVLQKYPFARTREQKIALARELGMESIEQLYNLANRLGATRPQQDRLADDALAQQESMDPIRLLLREDPEETIIAPWQDTYLTAEYGRKPLEMIAYYCDHSETSMMVRARELGLRRFCKYFPADKVQGWTGMSEEQLHDLGVDYYNCHDRRGKLAIRLVSASSLLRIASAPERRTALEAANCDRWLLRELDDLLATHARGRVQWEPSRWVSHGHVCLNPWAGLSFGHFDDGTDNLMSGRELLATDIAE